MNIRTSLLRQILATGKFVRVLEIHNALTAVIAENTTLVTSGITKEYNGMWLSSFTHSLTKGKPDNAYVDITSKLIDLNDIMRCTTKPVIIDGDNGGPKEHLAININALEQLGVSGIIIEDKEYPKNNSLRDNKKHLQYDKEVFAEKIIFAKKHQKTQGFMIIPRIESYISQAGLQDALTRAKVYIEAGADALMIHSNKTNPREIVDFCIEYNRLNSRVPLIAVPTTYNSIKEDELQKIGVNIVIYANHMLRTAFRHMQQTARDILQYSRSLEVENDCEPIENLLTIFDIDARE